MLTPARNANSRWRGSAETSGSMAWPSWRIAQAPAKSFDVMMIDDTPSPPPPGPLAASPPLAGSQRFEREVAGGEAAGKVLQEIERLGQHVVAPHRLELGNIERGEDGAQRLHAGTAGFAAGAGRCFDRVARVEQHGAALLHIG